MEWILLVQLLKWLMLSIIKYVLLIICVFWDGATPMGRVFGWRKQIGMVFVISVLQVPFSTIWSEWLSIVLCASICCSFHVNAVLVERNFFKKHCIYLNSVTLQFDAGEFWHAWNVSSSKMPPNNFCKMPSNNFWFPPNPSKKQQNLKFKSLKTITITRSPMFL